MLCVPARHERAIKLIANLAATAGVCAALPLWFQFDLRNPEFQFVERARWVPSIGAEYALGIDGFSGLMVLLTALIGFVTVLSSWSAVRDRVKTYYIVLSVVQTALLGTFMALDVLLFFLFWQAMLVPMYLLISRWGGERRSQAATKFLCFMLVGSVVMLLGILVLYDHHHAVTGVYSFDITRFQALDVPRGLQLWLFLAFFIGFAMTVPVFPFHAWVSDAHTAAPTAASVILAAIVLKLGTYGFIRVSLPILPDATRTFVPWMAALSLIGIVYGALAAMAQSDWKRLLAYFSLSHLAMATLGLFALTPLGITGSILQQINHGISIAALFLLVGIVDERRHTRTIAGYSGLAQVMPVCAVTFVVMAMSSIGLPALNGFVGQALILRGVFAANRWWAVAGGSGLALGAVYMLWLSRRTLYGKTGMLESGRALDLSLRDYVTCAPLVALAVWIGLYPTPVLDRLTHPVTKVVFRVDPSLVSPAEAAASGCTTPGKATEGPESLTGTADGGLPFIEPPCGIEEAPTAP